jgi:hypothetical protein
MAVRRNPSRSSRSTIITSSAFESAWFPDITNPESVIHRQINTLNREAYPSEIFARADDLLMFMAFAKKGKKRRHHEVLPDPAQSSTTRPPPKEFIQAAIQAANICKDRFKLFNGTQEPSWEAVVRSIEALQQEVSIFRSEDEGWSACLSQYAARVIFIHSFVSLFDKFAVQIFAVICIWQQRQRS